MIEPLEARIAPAGIVEVLVKAGALTLKTLAAGDGDENLLITSTGPGLFTIDPDAATTLRVNGADLAPGALTNVFGITKGVTINTGTGNDTVDFSGDVGGKLGVDLSDGNDTFILRASNYAGDVSIKGGAGNDSVTSATGGNVFVIGGKLTVALGEGNNTLGFTTTATIARDVLITSGTGNDSLAIDGPNSFFIGGNLTMLSGAGGDTVRVNLGDTLSVGKNVTFTSLGGAPTVSQTITSQRGPTVGGKVTFLGIADTTLTQTISASALDINLAGAVSFTGSAKSSVTQSIVASAQNLHIGGATTFKATSSVIDQKLDGNTLALGAVKMSATIKLQAIIPPEAVAELAIVNSATQTIVSDLIADSSASSIKGPVTLSGADTVSFAVVGEVRGAVSITGVKDFTNTIAIGTDNASFTSRFLGPVKVVLGSNQFTTESVTLAGSMFAGPVTVLGAAAQTTLAVKNSIFARPVLFNGGAGNDTVNWETGTLAGRDGRVLASLKVIGGAGADVVNLGGNAAADAVTFLGLVSFDGGADADTLTVGTAARLLLTPALKNVETAP